MKWLTEKKQLNEKIEALENDIDMYKRRLETSKERVTSLEAQNKDLQKIKELVRKQTEADLYLQCEKIKAEILNKGKPEESSLQRLSELQARQGQLGLSYGSQQFAGFLGGLGMGFAIEDAHISPRCSPGFGGHLRYL